MFLREEFWHTGSLSPLLCTHAELEKAMGRAVLKGYRLKELLVVEFCDTADAEGRYRKYSAYVVGSEVITRGMARGRDWMLKAGGIQFSEEMLLEERAYVLGNQYECQLRRIFTVSGIEFGLSTWPCTQCGRYLTARRASSPPCWRGWPGGSDDRAGNARGLASARFSAWALAALAQGPRLFARFHGAYVIRN